MNYFNLFIPCLFIFTNLESQSRWSKFYNNNLDIIRISTNELGEEIALADESRLIIANSAKGLSFTGYTYTLQGKTFRAKYSNSGITHLTYNEGDLYVSTKDTNLVLYSNFKSIGALPLKIFDTKNQYIGGFLASMDFQKIRMVGTVDVEDATIRAFEGHNLNFTDFDIQDIGNGREWAGIDKKTGNLLFSNTLFDAIKSIPIKSNAFSKIFEIEVSDLISKRIYYWLVTDKGLAFVNSSGLNDHKDLTSNPVVKILNTDNSFLKSNNIKGLQTYTQSSSKDINANTLFAFSNNPPTVYIFNAWGDKYCIYNSSNSPLSATIPISDLCHSYENIFIAQGKSVFRMYLGSIGFNSSFTYCNNFSPITPVTDISQKINLKLYPNPTNKILTIASNQYSLLLSSAYSIFSIDGDLITTGVLSSNKIDTGLLNAGTYIINFKTRRAIFTGKFIKL